MRSECAARESNEKKRGYTDFSLSAKSESKGKPDIRERLSLYGQKKLSDCDLIALLLRTGTKELPLIRLAALVKKLIEIEDEDTLYRRLKAIKGFGASRASVIIAALELGRRSYGFAGTAIHNARDVYDQLRRYAYEQQEHFICLSLNGAYEIINLRVVTIGLLDKTLVHPREVFAYPVQNHAAAIIACHNHPSGVLEPSSRDKELTARLFEAGKILGIYLLDHVIISRKGFFSFMENDMLDLSGGGAFSD